MITTHFERSCSLRLICINKFAQRERERDVHIYIYIYNYIRRPRPSPRQGRRLGPPQVWNFSFLASQRHIHHFFWAVQPAVRQALHASNPSRSQQAPQWHINGFLWASRPPLCQPSNRPRPHQWLLMGVQACRLPALKPLKRLKTLKTLKTRKTRKNPQNP